MNQKTINKIFEEQTACYSENVAVLQDTVEISYRQLNAGANRISHALVELGSIRQNITGLYFDETIEYIVSLLAVLKSGGVFMPINTLFPDQRIEFIINKTKPDIFIVAATLEETFFKRLQNFNLRFNLSYVILVDHDFNFTVKSLSNKQYVIDSKHLSTDNLQIDRDLNKACYIITTSGSTGEPKIILGSHDGLNHFIQWEINEFHINQNDRISMLSPVTFDVSLRDIFVPLLSGGTLCVPDYESSHNPTRLLQWLKDKHMTLIHIVPTLFRMLTRTIEDVNTDEPALPDLRSVLIAGEPLYWNDVINWRKADGNRTELVNLYGPSETTLAKCYFRIKDGTFKSEEIVPIGKPIPETEVFIIENNTACSMGETGELYIRTPFMSHGYYDDTELNRVAFVQNPLVKDRDDIVYRTGDLGKLLPDGNVTFEGRVDGQIKLYGNRVETGEIEVALRQHNDVRNAAVTARPDSFGNPRLVSYIEPVKNEMPSVESLRNILEGTLPDYMIPSVFVTLEELPRTLNGKIDRRALPQPERTRPELEQPYVAPTTPLEATLCSAWAHVLDIDRVGIHDNFFNLGGTSILSVKLIALIQNRLGFEIPIAKLFQYPNVHMLATYLNQDPNYKPTYEKVQNRAQKQRSTYSRIKRNKNNT